MEKKLNLKKGMKLHVIGNPATVKLGGVETTTSARADAVIVFAKTLAEVDAKAGPAVEAAKEDRIAWVAYPKAGQLDTDLNRDILWKHLLKQGVQAVRQVAIDDVWSALRFRPRK
jgi:hypothetical protein